MSEYISTFDVERDSTEIATALIQHGGVILSELMPAAVMDTILEMVCSGITFPC